MILIIDPDPALLEFPLGPEPEPELPLAGLGFNGLPPQLVQNLSPFCIGAPQLLQYFILNPRKLHVLQTKFPKRLVEINNIFGLACYCIKFILKLWQT